MKLLKKAFEKNGGGYVSLMPETSEDLWFAYNLITKHDGVQGTTIRKIHKDTGAGNTQSDRVRLTLTLDVHKVEFDADGGKLRIAGKNIQESPHVRLGAHHTIDIEVNRKVTISKEYFDTITIESIDQACDPRQSADVMAVTMEEGMANVCLISQSLTLVRARIEVSIPRKRGAAEMGVKKALDKFHIQIFDAILRHANLDVIKAIIIASPGFVKDRFVEFLWAEAARRGCKQLMDARSKVMLVHCASGHLHSLNEVLQSPTVKSQLADTVAARDSNAMDLFYKTLNDDPDRALYGPRHVLTANDRGAIATLMITDTLFRTNNIPLRKQYVSLVEAVRAAGGVTLIFSSMHPSGEQLSQLSGVAAILRFPCPDITEENGEDGDDDVAHDSDDERGFSSYSSDDDDE